MAKKDENGRIVIPKDIVENCTFLSKYDTFEKKKLVFFINNQDEIGVSIIMELLPLPDDVKFLGTCDYDSASHTILIPENVDVALGDGEDYYFATAHEEISYLYIYKRQTDIQKLSAILSNIAKNLDGFEAYIDEDVDD